MASGMGRAGGCEFEASFDATENCPARAGIVCRPCGPEYVGRVPRYNGGVSMQVRPGYKVAGAEEMGSPRKAGRVTGGNLVLTIVWHLRSRPNLTKICGGMRAPGSSGANSSSRPTGKLKGSRSGGRPSMSTVPLKAFHSARRSA